MLRTIAFCPLAVASLAGAAGAQTSWTVDDDGPADFATIAAAVGSALVQDGDVLLVEPGYYGHSITSKALAIVGRAGGVLPVVNVESRVESAGSFTLAGMKLEELLVRKVPGRVTIEDCEIGHDSIYGGGIPDTFLLEDCAEVVVSNSLLQGKTGDQWSEIESPGVSIRNSRVAVVNCAIHGGEGADDSFGGFPGQPGIDIEDGSLVVVAACSITGGNGGQSNPPIEPAPAEPFLTVTGESGPGGLRRLNLYGPAGSVALVLVSLQPLYATLPKIQGGPLWLDPAGQVLSLQVALMGQALSVNVLFPLPATGDYAGFTAWLQAFLPAGGSKWLAFNPGSIVLRF